MKSIIKYKYGNKAKKKISILPQIKKFKQNLINKKYKFKKDSPVSEILFQKPQQNPQKSTENLSQKSQKRKNETVLQHQSKKQKIDSIILRNQSEDMSIGSEEQRKKLPFTSTDSNNQELFTGNKCRNCKLKFLTKPAKINHINIFRKKRNVVHVPTSIFDINKYMNIICMSEFCCQSFTIIDDYYSHIANEHNQLPTDTLPIYQNPNIQTYPELTCRMCRGEFTTKFALKRHEKNCTGMQLFFCDFCEYSDSDFNNIIKHGKNSHQKSIDFQILEKFTGLENNQKSEKNLMKSSIYKTYTKIFSEEYTSMTEALSNDNLKQMYRIIKNTKAKKEDFKFALCMPVIISKSTEYGIEYRLRYFRTKAIKASSKRSIISALNGSKLSLLLQSEHLEETGSGWVVQHCRRVDLIITKINGVSFFI